MDEVKGKVPVIISFGSDSSWMPVVRQLAAGCQIVESAYVETAFENPLRPDVDIVLCGYPSEGVSVSEIAQSFRMLYPEAPIYFMVSNRTHYDRKANTKNGFTDAFLYPGDEGIFSKQLKADLTRASRGAIRSYRSIKLMDVSPDTKLGFDLYLHLPMNNRKVRYVASTSNIGSHRAEKLKAHNVESAFVSTDQMQNFYDFTAKCLKDIDSAKGISETERAERRERAVRDLLAGVFTGDQAMDSIENGRQMVNDCQEIVKSYIFDPDAKDNWYEKMMALSKGEENTIYDHASNTATIAALLSYALAIGDPKELALAGMLHDIGLADVPAEIVNKDISQMTPDERKKYENHPFLSANLVKQRRMILSENVLAIIEQHHERFDGTGYPSQLPGPRVRKDAQLLAFADMVDELARIRPGQPALSLKDAIEKVCADGLGNPSASAIDPSILTKIRSVFAQSNKGKQNAA